MNKWSKIYEQKVKGWSDEGLNTTYHHLIDKGVGKLNDDETENLSAVQNERESRGLILKRLSIPNEIGDDEE